MLLLKYGVLEMGAGAGVPFRLDLVYEAFEYIQIRRTSFLSKVRLYAHTVQTLP